MNEKSLAQIKSNEAQLMREMQQVQGQILMAKKFPRDEVQAIERIKNACTRVELAEDAEYTYNRGGTDINGATIKLLEVVAQCWGNIDFGVREVDHGEGESVVESFAWDIETNTRSSKTFTVEHVRYANKKMIDLVDPRDIYEVVANNASRRLRAALETIIPRDIVEMARKECAKTLKAKCDTSPDAIKKLVEAFGKRGVSKEQIEQFIGRKIEAMTPALMVRLIAIGNSMRDGLSDAKDWFKPVEVNAEKVKPEPKKESKAEKKEESEKPKEEEVKDGEQADLEGMKKNEPEWKNKVK